MTHKLGQASCSHFRRTRHLLSGRQCMTEVVTSELYLLQHVDIRAAVDVCDAIFLGRGRLPRVGESIIRQKFSVVPMLHSTAARQ